MYHCRLIIAIVGVVVVAGSGGGDGDGRRFFMVEDFSWWLFMMVGGGGVFKNQISATQNSPTAQVAVFIASERPSSFFNV